MLLSSRSSDMISDLLASERVFNSAKEMDGGGREMDGGAGGRERRLLGLAVRNGLLTGVRELVQSEGMLWTDEDEFRQAVVG